MRLHMYRLWLHIQLSSVLFKKRWFTRSIEKHEQLFWEIERLMRQLSEEPKK